MDNNTKAELQKIQEIFDEYLARSSEIDSDYWIFVGAFSGKIILSEEKILELRLEAAADPEFKLELDNYFEKKIKLKKTIFNRLFPLFGSFFVVTIGLTFYPIIPLSTLDISFLLVVSSLGFIMTILERKAANSYRTLRTMINVD